MPGDAVEHGRDHLRAHQAHVVERLVDHQLLHHELVLRHRRHPVRERVDLVVEPVGRNGFQHEAERRRFDARRSCRR